jgi:hypothetical protein
VPIDAVSINTSFSAPFLSSLIIITVHSPFYTVRKPNSNEGCGEQLLEHVNNFLRMEINNPSNNLRERR